MPAAVHTVARHCSNDDRRGQTGRHARHEKTVLRQRHLAWRHQVSDQVAHLVRLHYLQLSVGHHRQFGTANRLDLVTREDQAFGGGFAASSCDHFEPSEYR